MRLNSRMTLLSGAALAIALGSVPARADFLAVNGLTVRQSADGVISVPWHGLSGAPYFWCAAGDYVLRALHMPTTTRIWRLSPPPRHSGEGITFSLSPEGASSKTGLLVIPDDGSLSAASATELCESPRPHDDDN